MLRAGCQGETGARTLFCCFSVRSETELRNTGNGWTACWEGLGWGWRRKREVVVVVREKITLDVCARSSNILTFLSKFRRLRAE